jgi:hypothetical protein
MTRIVVKRGDDLWLLRDAATDITPNHQLTPQPATASATRSADGRPTEAAPAEIDLRTTPAPRRTTSDPEVLALATILADVELWCPDPVLRAKLQGAWTIPAAELMLGVRTADSTPETEWGVRWPALGVVACTDESSARRIIKEQDFGNVTLVSRPVRTIGPWSDTP